MLPIAFGQELLKGKQVKKSRDIQTKVSSTIAESQQVDAISEGTKEDFQRKRGGILVMADNKKA